MPVSKRGKLYYTAEQYAVARDASALEYARAAGYDLVREGSMYHLREHDSMVFAPDGAWHWNAQGLHGRAIEFLTQYEQKTPIAAVLILAGEQSCNQTQMPRKTTAPYHAKLPTEPPKPFELPPRADNFRRLFAYLCTTRKLDPELVQDLIHDHRIYESIRNYTNPKTGEVKPIHNAVFVGMDKDGEPQSAFQRGLNSFGTAYKGDVPGSEKSAAFCIPGSPGVTEVAVFEAAIDAISHASIVKLGEGDCKELDRIAIGGMAPAPVLRYLEEHPQVKTVRLCLDSDAPGMEGAARIGQALEQKGYFVKTELPDLGKDWNEFLCEWRGALEAAPRPTPEPEGDELEP